MTRGPQPKPNAIRRNVHEHATEIANEARPGRELPKGLGITTSGAKRFWKTWSEAPQTSEWTETDWTELEITAKLVDAFYKGDVKLAGEIRQRVAKWGATVEDRARLRMKLEDQDGSEDQDQGDGSTEAPPSEAALDAALYELLKGA